MWPVLLPHAGVLHFYGTEDCGKSWPAFCVISAGWGVELRRVRSLSMSMLRPFFLQVTTQYIGKYQTFKDDA